MLDKLKQAGQMAKAMNEARKLQKALEGEKVEIEDNGVKVVVNGVPRILDFSVNGVSNKAVINVLNKAIEKAQMAYPTKMREMPGIEDMMKNFMK